MNTSFFVKYISCLVVVATLTSCNTTQSKVDDFQLALETQLVHFDSLATTPLYIYQAEQAMQDVAFLESHTQTISELRDLTTEEPALLASIEARMTAFLKGSKGFYQNAKHYQLDKILQTHVDTTTTLESEMALVYPKLLKVPAFLHNAKALLEAPQIKHAQDCQTDLQTVFQRVKSRYIPMNPYLKTDPETRLRYQIACEQTNLAIKDFVGFLASKQLE